MFQQDLNSQMTCCPLRHFMELTKDDKTRDLLYYTLTTEGRWCYNTNTSVRIYSVTKRCRDTFSKRSLLLLSLGQETSLINRYATSRIVIFFSSYPHFAVLIVLVDGHYVALLIVPL